MNIVHKVDFLYETSLSLTSRLTKTTVTRFDYMNMMKLEKHCRYMNEMIHNGIRKRCLLEF